LCAPSISHLPNPLLPNSSHYPPPPPPPPTLAKTSTFHHAHLCLGPLPRSADRRIAADQPTPPSLSSLL
ncbi:hypothetical protein COCCADRAFT_85675, partial [Bipolaris zeicola 26-R-13]